MSCSGLHCAGCAGGAAIPAGPLLAVFGLAWVTEHIIEVAIVCGVSGALAVAAVVTLMRWTERRESAFAIRLALTRERGALATAAKPQVTQGTAPRVIEHHHYVHYVADGREPARVTIPGKVLP